MKFTFIFFLLFYYAAVFGQTSLSPKIDVSGAEAYINIATEIESGVAPDLINWSQLFTAPGYQFLVRNGGVDTTVLKSDMLKVYHPGYVENTSLQNKGSSYHYDYKKVLLELARYIKRLKSIDVVDSVKNLLYPFLPQRLQTPGLFPQLYYLYYGQPDATNIYGMVFNDLLLSYKIDGYKAGLVTSHEAIHAIVSIAFAQRLAKNVDQNSPEFNLLSFMENISEEGIADLIDKQILQQKNSPVYETVNELRKNDTLLSIRYIKSLDSLFTISNTTDSLLNKYNNFSGFANQFGKNGAHIPGRFMGLVIKEGGKLNAQIQSIEDPVAFFLNYNEAAKKLEKKKYPLFSDASIAYLEKLKNKMMKE